MQSVVPHTARHYGRAVIMPNLTPPVTTVRMVRSMCTAVHAACPHPSLCIEEGVHTLGGDVYCMLHATVDVAVHPPCMQYVRR